MTVMSQVSSTAHYVDKPQKQGLSDKTVSLLATYNMTADITEAVSPNPISAPLSFAAVSGVIPICEGMIEITHDQLGVGVYTTVGNVLRAHNIPVANIHWWHVYSYIKDGKAIYTIRKDVPVEDYKLAGFAFATNDTLRAFWGHSEGVKHMDYLKICVYLRVLLAQDIHLIENWVNRELVKVTLKDGDEVIASNDYVINTRRHIECATQMLIESYEQSFNYSIKQLVEVYSDDGMAAA